MENDTVTNEAPVCFVIMPFRNPEGYENGHFREVYDSIFKPAIESAGFRAVRVDEDSASTFIHTKIYRHLSEDPMVLCDLSSKNPNVFYELGIRHALRKPVVLVQEQGQERVFDVSGITTIDYCKDLRPKHVIDAKEKITIAIKQTFENGIVFPVSFSDIADNQPNNERKTDNLSAENHEELLTELIFSTRMAEEALYKTKTSTGMSVIREAESVYKQMQLIMQKYLNVGAPSNAIWEKAEVFRKCLESYLGVHALEIEKDNQRRIEEGVKANKELHNALKEVQRRLQSESTSDLKQLRFLYADLRHLLGKAYDKCEEYGFLDDALKRTVEDKLQFFADSDEELFKLLYTY